MTLLNNHSSEILAGYDVAQNAERRLLRQWRERLLAAYAQQRIPYDIERRVYRQRFHQYKIRALTGFAVIGGVYVIAVFLLMIGSTTTDRQTAQRLLAIGGNLFLYSFLITVVLGLLWLWFAKFAAPSPPQHPFKANLIPPIYPQWREELMGKLPTVREYEGAAGEYSFIRRMQQTLDESHFILYRLQFKHGDDVDVAIVGPKGIWVFEVKYWSGKIIYHNGQWSRVQTYYETGGIQATKRPEVKQAPDEQWQRMAEYTAKTLRIQAPWLVSRYLTGLRIQGGIAFTNSNGEYNIAHGCPTEWGDIRHWVHRMSTAPAIPGWDERTTFAVLDALLKRHHQIQSVTNSHSMKAHAHQLVGHAESDLAAWVNVDNESHRSIP